MPVLFDAATLSALSGRQVTDEQATAIHGWVLAVIEGVIGALPDAAVPPAVVAVAVELGRAAVPAPGGVISQSVGPYSATYALRGVTTDAVLSRDQKMRLRRAVGKTKAFDVDTRPPCPPHTVPDGGWPVVDPWFDPLSAFDPWGPP